MRASITAIVLLLALLIGTQPALCTCADGMEAAPGPAMMATAMGEDAAPCHPQPETPRHDPSCSHCVSDAVLTSAAVMDAAPRAILLPKAGFAVPVSSPPQALPGVEPRAPVPRAAQGPPALRTPVSLKTRLLN